MFSIGPQELIGIFILVLILFGGRKVPEVMRSIGQGLREFRRISQQATDDLRQLTEVEDEPENTNKPV